jgi:hemerythrin-like metal-binding protein
MNLEELQLDCAIKQKKGLHFILASIIIWCTILIIHLTSLPILTKTHFRDEEKYMESIKYPELEAQKKAHAYFEQELAQLRKDYTESGGSLVLLVKANKMIVDWLTKHISSMDKKIGEYAAALK